MATIIKTADVDLSNPSPNWKVLAKKYSQQVLKLPQVESGLVSITQAQKWLSNAAQVLSESELRREIHSSKGFTEQDIRALWAHDHNEYYAKYHASEVYSLKRLESIKIPTEQDRKQIVLQSLFKALITDKYNLQSAKYADQAQFIQSDHNWVNSSPSLMKTETGENILISIKFNYQKDITQSDDIRNHVQILSLLNSQQRVDSAYQYNINIPEEKLEVLSSTALLGSDAFKQSLSLLKIWDTHATDMNVNFEKVTYSKSLFGSISQVSQAHWDHLLNGQTVEMPLDNKSQMTAQQESAFLPVAKRYAAAQRLQVAASKEFDSVKQEIADLVSTFGIPRKMDSHFDLVKVGARNVFDLDRAVNFLQRSNVDPAHYTSAKYDIDSLAKEATSKGVDVEKYRSYSAPNKEKVITTLEVLGVDKSQFNQSANHIHFTGQTRGGVYDRVSELEGQTQATIEDAITTIAKGISLPPEVELSEHTETSPEM